jgi:hypothetical protein
MAISAAEISASVADDGIVLAVQPDGLADNTAVCAKATAPEPIAEVHLALAAGLVFAGLKRATEGRLIRNARPVRIWTIEELLA